MAVSFVFRRNKHISAPEVVKFPERTRRLERTDKRLPGGVVKRTRFTSVLYSVRRYGIFLYNASLVIFIADVSMAMASFPLPAAPGGAGYLISGVDVVPLARSAIFHF